MSDRTSLQVYVYDCPEDQRQAAGEVLADMQADEGQNTTAYAVYDDTRNPAGEAIKRGEDALRLRTFAKIEDAEAFAAEGNDRSVEPVELVTIGDRYIAYEISCGSADEYAANLIEAAPGCSFVLWEDPAYQWLGSLWAHTPQLGTFAAECTAEGQPVYTASEITAMVEGLPPGTDLAAHIGQQTGSPWFDDWHEHASEQNAA